MEDLAQRLRMMAENERAIADESAERSGDYTPEARSYYQGVVDGLRMAADVAQVTETLAP